MALSTKPHSIGFFWMLYVSFDYEKKPCPRQQLIALSSQNYRFWHQVGRRSAARRSLLGWVRTILTTISDPALVAALASSPEQAAEVYLASVLVVDEESFMERAYLDELARRLSLDLVLKNDLEAKVKSLA